MSSDIKLGSGTLKEQMSSLPEEQLHQIVSQSNQFHSYINQMQMLEGIAKDMRQIAELPSETISPKDTNPITKIEFPDEGGVLTYMQGFEHPFPGYPYHEFVEKIDSIKKFTRQLLSGFYHELKGSKWKLLTLLPALWMVKKFVRAYTFTIGRLVERFVIKPERYCMFVRELHRAFSLERLGESENERNFRLRLRDTVCMILEFDNAYRFRAQDILGELDKESLRNTKEVIRLLDLMSSREASQEIRDTWTLLKIGVRGYIAFDWQLQKLLKSVLRELNLEKVRLSEGDKEFCTPRKDYVFGFQLNPSQSDQVIIEKCRKKSEWQEEKGRLLAESTKAHEELYAKQRKEKEESKEDLLSKHLLERQELDKKYENILTDAEKRHKSL